jgi:hypothetical protein
MDSLDEKDDAEKLDKGRILIVAVALLLLVIGIVIVNAIWQHLKIAPYKAQCESNPRLRYAQNCTTYQDCVKKCSEALAS